MKSATTANHNNMSSAASTISKMSTMSTRAPLSTLKLAASDAARVNALKEEGNRLFRMGNNEAAIQPFSQALQIDTKSAVLLSNRSAAFCAMREYEKALTDANNCVANAPEWTKGYLRRGAALYGLGRFDEAAVAYFRGYDKDESNPDFKVKVAAIKADKETNEQAKYHGSAYLQKGQFADALKWLDRALVGTPNDPMLKIERAACFACTEIGRLDASVCIYGKLLTLRKLKLKPKWFSVQNTTFCYYPEDTPDKPKFTLSLMGARVTDVQGKEFVVNGPTTWPRVFRLRAESQEDAKVWVAAINGGIAMANSKVTLIPSTDMNTVWQPWTAGNTQDRMAPQQWKGVGLY